MINDDNKVYLFEMLKAIRNFCDSILDEKNLFNNKLTIYDALLINVSYINNRNKIDYISLRTINILKRENILTVNDLLKKTMRELCSYWGFGKSAKIEIEAMLNYKGWNLV